MSVTVYLANQGFTLPATDFDDRRREAYFKNPADANNKLLPEEDKILVALGINKENASCLMPYLGRFFKELPKCQSDASLTLSKDCEIVQYVLWETMLAAKARSQQMYDDNWKTKKPWGDISVAINQQIINDLKPKPEDISDIDRIFTLILNANIPVDNTIDNLFTLIVKAGPPPPPIPPAPPIPPLPPGMAPILGPSSGLDTLPAPPTPPLPPGMAPLVDPSPEPDKETPSSPQDSPSSSVITAPSGSSEEDEFQQTNPMLEKGPSINHLGKNPFTKQSTEIPLGGPERGPPLGVVPPNEDVTNQCEGRPRPTELESHEEEFKRSLYFFHSVKTQKDINLTTLALEPAVETKFLADWQKAIKGSRDKITTSLKFLGVPANKLLEMNGLYHDFINGGERPNPILAHGCNKIGETAAGMLERFYETVERTPSERMYLFQHGDWPSGNGSDISLDTPTSVNDVNVSVRDKTRNDYFLENQLYHLTILTTQDIDYTENNDFDYNIQGRHITDYLLIRDLFAKNKNYVLDISPQLIYLFYKERNIPRPTPDGGSITINDAFFKNAFDGNHIPPQLSLNPQVQEQVDMAYYAICNKIMIGRNKPYKFYSKPTSSKLNDIIEWLENATDRQYAPISNLMRWAVPAETPIGKSVLLDLFKSVAKKPQSFFRSMFTRKNKKNMNNATTRRAQAPPVSPAPQAPQAPVNALTAARAAVVPSQQVLKAPDVPKKGTRSWKNWLKGKKGMNNATVKNILARAEPRPGSVAASLGIPRTQVQTKPQAQPQAQVQAPTPRPGSVAAQVAAQAAATSATEQAIQRTDAQITALREQKTRLDEEFQAKKAQLAKNIRTKPKDQQLRIIKNIKSLEQSKTIKQRTIDLRIAPLNKQRKELIDKQTKNLLSRAPVAPTNPIVISPTGEEPSSDPTVRALQEQVARNAAMIEEDRRRRAPSSANNTDSNTDTNTDNNSSVNSEEANSQLSAENEKLLREAGITSNKRSRNGRRTRRKRNTKARNNS